MFMMMTIMIMKGMNGESHSEIPSSPLAGEDGRGQDKRTLFVYLLFL